LFGPNVHTEHPAHTTMSQTGSFATTPPQYPSQAPATTQDHFKHPPTERTSHSSLNSSSLNHNSNPTDHPFRPTVPSSQASGQRQLVSQDNIYHSVYNALHQHVYNNPQYSTTKTQELQESMRQIARTAADAAFKEKQLNKSPTEIFNSTLHSVLTMDPQSFHALTPRKINEVTAATNTASLRKDSSNRMTTEQKSSRELLINQEKGDDAMKMHLNQYKKTLQQIQIVKSNKIHSDERLKMLEKDALDHAQLSIELFKLAAKKKQTGKNDESDSLLKISKRAESQALNKLGLIILGDNAPEEVKTLRKMQKQSDLDFIPHLPRAESLLRKQIDEKINTLKIQTPLREKQLPLKNVSQMQSVISKLTKDIQLNQTTTRDLLHKAAITFQKMQKALEEAEKQSPPNKRANAEKKLAEKKLSEAADVIQLAKANRELFLKAKSFLKDGKYDQAHSILKLMARSNTEVLKNISRLVIPNKYQTIKEKKRTLSFQENYDFNIQTISYDLIKALESELNQPTKKEVNRRIRGLELDLKSKNLPPLQKEGHFIDLDNEEVRIYNKEGKLEEVRNYNKEGKLEEVRNYNKEGKLEEVRIYNKEGKLEEVRNYNKEVNLIDLPHKEVRTKPQPKNTGPSQQETIPDLLDQLTMLKMTKPQPKNTGPSQQQTITHLLEQMKKLNSMQRQLNNPTTRGQLPCR
jgi:hypothetical protein